ncbi:MAG: hypothetical protein RI897_3681 [Verrucomicrobiota bacterium]|jgi:hypothetical protein
MTTDITLLSGRTVSLERLTIRNTYAGFFLGHPAKISELIWKSFPLQIEQEFGKGVLILKPEEPILPCYTLIAELTSDPIPSNEPEDFSSMTVCWFQNTVDGNVTDFARNAMKGLAWEEHAHNWSW